MALLRIFTLVSLLAGAETTTTLSLPQVGQAPSSNQQPYSPYLRCINGFSQFHAGYLVLPVRNGPASDSVSPRILFGSHAGNNGFFVFEANRVTFEKVSPTYNANQEPFYSISYDSPTEPGLGEYSVYVKDGKADYARTNFNFNKEGVAAPHQLGINGTASSAVVAEQVFSNHMLPMISRISMYHKDLVASTSFDIAADTRQGLCECAHSGVEQVEKAAEAELL